MQVEDPGDPLQPCAGPPPPRPAPTPANPGRVAEAHADRRPSMSPVCHHWEIPFRTRGPHPETTQANHTSPPQLIVLSPRTLGHDSLRERRLFHMPGAPTSGHPQGPMQAAPPSLQPPSRSKALTPWIAPCSYARIGRGPRRLQLVTLCKSPTHGTTAPRQCPAPAVTPSSA